MGEIDEIIEYLQQLSSLYSKITQSMFDQEILFNKDSHSLLAAFVATLNERLVKQGHIKDYFELSETLIKYGERFLSHRFTAKQLNDFQKLDSKSLQPHKILDFYKQIDDIGEKNNESNIELRNNIRKLKELWEINPLPKNFVIYQDKFNLEEEHPIKFREFTGDLFSKLGQAYETFVLFSTFLLLMFRKIKDQQFSEEKKAFLKGRKLPFFKIYQNDEKQTNFSPLLKDYLISEFPNATQLVNIFDWVFGKEGVREIRNLGIHHQGEKGKCEIYEKKIVLYFQTNLTKEYTYENLADIYRQLQFLIFLIYYTNCEMYINFWIVMLKKEREI